MTKLKDSITPTENQIKVIAPTDCTPSKPAHVGTNPKLKALVEEESKIVKGRFRHYETPGGSLRVQVKKYKELPMFDKTMHDGMIYEVPLYVARHLNGVDKVANELNGQIGTCSYPIHGFKWDGNKPLSDSFIGSGPNGELGVPQPITTIARRVRRFGFESLDFSEAVSA